MKAISKAAQKKMLKARLIQEQNNDALISLAQKMGKANDDRGLFILATINDILTSRGLSPVSIHDATAN